MSTTSTREPLLRWAIVNDLTGEIVHLGTGARAVHPEWVHKQMCTSSEQEIQRVLGGYRRFNFPLAGVQAADALGIFLDEVDEAYLLTAALQELLDSTEDVMTMSTTQNARLFAAQDAATRVLADLRELKARGGKER